MLQPTAYSARVATGDFQARLERVARVLSSRHVVIGMCDGADEVYASTPSTVPDNCPISDAALPIECLAKLFTAVLVHAAVRRGEFDWHSDVSELLGGDSTLQTLILRGITVKHLIEHTHGLDAAAIGKAPIDAAGFIDAGTLIELTSQAPPLAPPGRLFNYSSIGYWLAAAILERRHQHSYSHLLGSELLSPGRAASNVSGGARHSLGAADHCCPALGGPLQLSLREVLRFLAAQFRHDAASMFQASDFPALCAAVVPLAGWNPTESGIYLGWKHYGAGWFGHNAKAPGSNTLLRVNPERQQAVVVSTKDQSAMLIAATLFADLLPEFRNFRMPAILKDGTRLDPRALSGIYGDGATAVSIAARGAGASGLGVRAYRKPLGSRAPDPFFSASLTAAAGDVFLCQPVDPDLFPYLQFLMPGEHGYEFLWNGSSVWRRQAAAGV